ncbi:cytochrome [Mangrovactinospora gilvigrisea]|uniref:Cytochrome n=1 Tax=Mangrovactinospora gilvigrisea TaxID=1428644 RepID=A0A1J7CGE7_9ACTN|nr:cytochrome P450 [Mangrovactinospora gilvigrisea]OIV38738.1 cytochrome [Mangrovactinospora gilvigrisea]
MATPSSPAPGCPFHLDGSASDIHGEADLLRAQGPAVQVQMPGGVTAWSVTDPGLIKRLLTDPRVSKDAYQHWPDYIDGQVPAEWPLRVWVDVRNALTAYGSEHTRLRRLIGTAFTARRVRALLPTIEVLTGGLLDAVDAAPTADGIIDLRARFTFMLPLAVVNTLLGVPEDLHDAFREALTGVFATDIPADQAAVHAQTAYALLAQVVQARRADPGDDVTSALIAAHDDETGTKLSDQELLDSIFLLIGAGHETTVNLLGHSIVNLLTHPDQLALVQQEKASWNDAIEESLRHQAPIASIPLRYAVEDIHDTSTGATFRRGEPLLIHFAAAGRDPGIHGPNADAFDVTRPTRREHLAFGFGTHYCLGAELARIEARVALPALFARFPQLHLALAASELKPLESFISNGHQALPVRLRAAPVEA